MKKYTYDKNSIFEAEKLLADFNKKDPHRIDWGVFFVDMTEEQLSDWIMTGLQNTDLIFSNWPQNHGIKRTKGHWFLRSKE